MVDEPPLAAGAAAQMLAQAETATGFLKAISHPARLVLLCGLAEGQANVSELEAFTDLPQAEVSKHLARLRQDGLVRAIRDGRSRNYALTEARTARIMRILHREFCGPAPDQPV